MNLVEAKLALEVAQNHFDNAVTVMEIDAAHHELMAAEIRLREAYRRATGREVAPA